MPNWCNNQVEISHPRIKKMRRLIGYIETGALCYSFAPYPNGEWNYAWCCSNWDTKWDITEADIFDKHTSFIQFSFWTAWAPPIAIYSKMEKQGYDLVALYEEGGVGYCGVYKNGQDREYDYRDKDKPDELKQLIGEEEDNDS